ncbi:methyltransferase domain-containing protein [Clavibacter sp. VKM Ac-2872]|uniref:methyltransferase domain-containing protein n=1 Tax=Clavibacter sp. VKM Ac-2872 TaxID=2783812 RepID=UPI00188CAA50|nr:methyltransferase domain-containing protein [Clavibacter sp. VKM Ac-2872]
MKSERYTHGHHESVLRVHSARTVRNSAAYLQPHLRPGLDVLDVGSGPGTITVELADIVAPGRVVGVDMSEDVVRQAAELAASRGTGNVEFVTGSVYDLPYSDASFDVVHAHQVLQHVGDPVRALAEMRRVTRPGGLVAARDVIYSKVALYPESDGLRLWSDVYLPVHRANGGEPDAGSRLKAWAREAGFTEIASSASVWCFTSDEERAWWGGAWADRAVASSFAGQAREGGFATDEDLLAIRAGWQVWAADGDGFFAMPHGEILARR